MGEKETKEITAYVLGIASIIMAFFNSGAGLVFGIVGLVMSKKSNSPISQKAKKFSIIGIVISIILMIFAIIAIIFAGSAGLGLLDTASLGY